MGGGTKDPITEACRATGNHGRNPTTKDTTRKMTEGDISLETNIKEVTSRAIPEMRTKVGKTGSIVDINRVTTNAATGKAIIKTDAAVKGAIGVASKTILTSTGLRGMHEIRDYL